MLHAIIDIGSNTIRMAVYQIEGRQFTLLMKRKHTVGLAGYLENGRLVRAGLEKTVKILHGFMDFINTFRIPHVHAFATAALRSAVNSRAAVGEIARRSGVQVRIISGDEEAMYDFIGATQNIAHADGIMIDIGGGTTEIGVISLGGIVHANSLRVAGDRFDEAIITYVRRNYGMLIGESTAEQIKKEVASAFPDGQSKEIEVKGRNLSEGIPRAFRISTNEIREALTAPLNHIVSAVKIALEEVPPEIGADISERGIMLTGGGAMIPGLDRLLAEETGLPTLISDEPLTCVVRGCGLALERMDELGGIFTHE